MILAGARGAFWEVDPVQAALSSGVAVFSAASGTQVSSSYPDKKHGLFTYFFLKGLRGAADGASGTPPDGSVTIGELGDYLSREVPYAAARLPHGREQTPVLQASEEVRARALR